MGAVPHDTEIPFSVPPARLYKALFLDGDNLIPTLFPDSVKSVQCLKGNGGPGTVKLITFAEGKSVKQRVDEVDEQNFVYKYSIIEGDALGGLESVSFVAKLEPSGNGSVCKISSKFHNKGHAQLRDLGHAPIKKEDIKSSEQKIHAGFKAIEAHLHANPHY